MTAHDRHGDRDTDRRETDETLPDALRWQLRELRREQAPTRDLWPDIAARLGPQPARDSRVRARILARTQRRWALPAALAATLVLALGVIGWQQGLLWQPTQPSLASRSTDTTPSLLQREAAGMTRQYQAALLEVDVVQPDVALALQPAFDELDRNARLILDALARDPDSRLLLQQLRRTYSHRLALARRVAIS